MFETIGAIGLGILIKTIFDSWKKSKPKYKYFWRCPEIGCGTEASATSQEIVDAFRESHEQSGTHGKDGGQHGVDCTLPPLRG
jgi:hypothetical protein